MVCWYCVVGVVLIVIYKLVDALLRWPRMNRLSERYIFVTGCDTGFGHGIAKRLDSVGCHVFAGCLTQKGQTELQHSCSDRLVTLSLDVSDPDSVCKAFDFVKNQLPANQGHSFDRVVSFMLAGVKLSKIDLTQGMPIHRDRGRVPKV